MRSEPSGRFLPVGAEETAFAMSLFVGAANGDLATAGVAELSAESLAEYSRLLWTISRAGAGTRRDSVDSQDLRSLDVAFLTLWKHYEGDERQASVCARVLGFYYLMEQTKGRLVEGWVTSCAESEEVVLLHPAVVATLSCTALSREGVLGQAEFVARLETHAM